MRIAIDARAFAWAGIGRYTRNILRELARLKTHHKFTVLVSGNDRSQFAEFKAELPNFTIQEVQGSYYSWAEQTTFLRQLNAVQADLWHFTHFNVPYWFKRPYAVTIHDITRFIFPGQRRQDLRQQLAYEFLFKRAVEQARALICVSKTTQMALQTLPLRLPALNEVIYEGVDDIFLTTPTASDRQKARMLIGTVNPFLLYVGVWMSHKNLPRLLAAFAEVLEHYPRLKLVLTGKPKPGYSNVVKIVQDLGITEHVIFAGFVPHHLLPALYAEATCLVNPSLYEGFGLPQLEALACGTPVVTSNVSSMPEILGNHAYYANPEYVPDIVAAISRVLQDPNRVKLQQQACQAHARQYRWSTSAQQHLQLYERVGKQLQR